MGVAAEGQVFAKVAGNRILPNSQGTDPRYFIVGREHRGINEPPRSFLRAPEVRFRGVFVFL